MFSQASCITLIICFVSHSYFVRAQDPQITYISKDQIRDVGGTASLNCTVENVGELNVNWIKTDPLKPGGGPVFISINTQKNIKSSRFSINKDTPFKLSTTYNLRISSIQKNDSGVYQCQIPIDTDRIISAEVKLQIRQPPVISDPSTKTIHVQEGEKNVRLECSAGGYPPPNVTWERENSVALPKSGVTYNENVLRFMSVSKTNRGIYYCIADNGVGSKATKKFKVEVEFPPVVTMAEPRVGQSLKYEMDLVCRVEADPSPVITWYKDKSKLVNNEHYRISQTAKATENAGAYESVIRLLSIQKNQYGFYECKAENNLGTGVNSTELFESSTPNRNYRGRSYNSGLTSFHHCHLLILFLISGLFLKFVSPL